MNAWTRLKQILYLRALRKHRKEEPEVTYVKPPTDPAFVKPIVLP